MPRALNCSTVPDANDGLVGVTAIETSDACVTVMAAVPLTDPTVAAIVLFPVLLPFTTPELMTLAVPGTDEIQAAEFVTSCLLPSEYVPVAVNCCCALRERTADAGVNTIETRAAGFTVRVVAPLMLPETAEIVVVPAEMPLATPPAFTVATPVTEELQIAEPVRFCMLPSV